LGGRHAGKDLAVQCRTDLRISVVQKKERIEKCGRAVTAIRQGATAKCYSGGVRGTKIGVFFKGGG